MKAKGTTLLITLLLLMEMMQAQYYNAIRFRINGNGYSDETIIRLLPGATSAFDGNYDAYKLFSLNNNVPSIFTRTSNQLDMSINSINPLNIDSSLTIFLNIPTQGNYSLDIEILYQFEQHYKISLTDNSSNTHYYITQDTTLLQTFNQGDSIAAFTFNISTPTQATSIDETCAGLHNGSISITNAGNNDWSYRIINTNGGEIENQIATTEQVDLINLIPGNYTIITKSKGIIDTVDVVINEGLNITADFQAVPDTISINNSFQPQNTSNNATTFLWNFDDGMTSNDIEPTHSYSEAGFYTITLIASDNACADTAFKQIVVMNNNTPTSINDYSENNIQLAQLDETTFRIKTTENINRLSLHTISGQFVKEIANKTVISLNDLASGIYILSVQTNNNTFKQFKIMKQ